MKDGVNLNVQLANASNTVTGGTGNDTVTGGNAGDTLSGGGGTDTLAGGAGQDTLTGDAGADVFSFTVANSQGAINLADLITDFADGVDIIDITGVADFNGDFASNFLDLTVDQTADRGVGTGTFDTVISDQTTGNVIAVLVDVTPVLNGTEFTIAA